VSWSDWLLFFHVGSAFVLGIALVGFWAPIVARLRPGGNPQMIALTLAPTSAALAGLGAAGTLLFGIWLAIERDEYRLWDGWILISLILLILGMACGQASGFSFRQAVGKGDAEAAALRRRGTLLHAAASILYLTILVLMIFKPGA
jgi:hypothetical protein